MLENKDDSEGREQMGNLGPWGPGGPYENWSGGFMDMDYLKKLIAEKIMRGGPIPDYPIELGNDFDTCGVVFVTTSGGYCDVEEEENPDEEGNPDEGYYEEGVKVRDTENNLPDTVENRRIRNLPRLDLNRVLDVEKVKNAIEANIYILDKNIDRALEILDKENFTIFCRQKVDAERRLNRLTLEFSKKAGR